MSLAYLPPLYGSIELPKFEERIQVSPGLSLAASISLTATKRVTGKKHFVDLRWSGATSSNVEIRRNGVVVTTTANDGVHADNLKSARGTFRSRVSHPGGAPISNEVAVTF